MEEATDAINAIVMELAGLVITEAKRNAHVITGTNRRSIKADRPGDVRDRTDTAKTRDLANPIPKPMWKNGVATLMVGGTTFYSIYEELLHPYMRPAWEVMITQKDAVIKAHSI